MVKDYYSEKSQNERMFSKDKTMEMIGRKPPYSNVFNLNTNRACKDNTIADCHGLISNNIGEWIGGFSRHPGRCSVFVTEIAVAELGKKSG